MHLLAPLAYEKTTLILLLVVDAIKNKINLLHHVHLYSTKRLVPKSLGLPPQMFQRRKKCQEKHN